MVINILGYEINLITQIMGLIELVIVLIGYLSKSKKMFFIYQVSANLFSGLGYLFIGKYVACFGTFISAARCIVYLSFELKHKQVPSIIVGYILTIYIINCILFYTSPLDIIPLFTLCYATVVFNIKNERLLKSLMIISSLILIAYNIVCLFITEAILKVLQITIIVIYLVKDYKKEKMKKQILEAV